MMKFFNFLILIQLFVIPIFAQEPEFDQEELILMRRYKASQLENDFNVISLKTTDSSHLFLRLYTDIPLNVAPQYRAFIEIEQQMLKMPVANLPKGWKTSDLEHLEINLQKDSMGYYLVCPTERLDTAVYLLSKILPQSNITAKQLDETKNNYKKSINAPEDPVTEKIEQITKGIIYGKNHPSIKKLTNKELDALTTSKYEEYYTHFYLPNNSYLLIKGAVDQETAVRATQKYFAEFKKKKLPASNYKLNKIEEGRVLFFDTLASKNYKLSMIFPFSLHPFTFDYEKSELLSLTVEKVLTERLITNNHLVSKITAGFHSDKVSGNYRIDLQLTDSASARVVEMVMQVIDELKHGQLEVYLLDQAQRELIDKFKQKATGERNISKLIINTVVNNLDDDYYSGFIRYVKNANNNRISSLAAKYLNYQSSVFSLSADWYPSLNHILKLSKNFRIEQYNLDGSVQRIIPKGFSGFHVLNDYIKALGGRAAIKKIKDLSIRLTGKYKMMGDELFIIGEIKHKAPDKFYKVLSLLRPKKDTIFINQQIFDGKRAIDRSMQGKKILKGNNLKSIRYKSVVVPEIKYQEWGFKTRILRADTMNNSYVYVVEFTNPAKQKIIDFYDVDKGIRYKRMVEDSAYLNKRSIIYKDYRKIDGANVLYPFYQHITGKGVDIQLIIRDINAKAKIEKELFEILEE